MASNTVITSEDAPIDTSFLHHTDGRPFAQKDLAVLGRNMVSGHWYGLPDQLRCHSAIFGRTGRGKSYFAQLLAQYITQDATLILLDPKGPTYEHLLDVCADDPLLARRVLCLNLSDRAYTFGYNPLRRIPQLDESVQLDLIMEAFLRVWQHDDGETGYSRTPRLYRWLRVGLRLLMRMGLTLVEGYTLFSLTDKTGRESLLQKARDMGLFRMIGFEMFEWLQRVPMQQREQQIESTYNRILRLVESEDMQAILGQTEHCLDFWEIMQSREPRIVLINTSQKGDMGAMLARMMLNEIVHLALHRPTDGSVPDVHVMCEEFGMLATPSVADALPVTRAFGVWFHVIAQFPDQLERAVPGILKNLFTNIDLRVVFGGIEPEDSDYLQRQLFSGQYNLLLPKGPPRIVHEPVQVMVDMVSRNYSTTEGENWNRAIARAIIRSRQQTRSRQTGSQHGGSEAQQDAHGTSYSRGHNWGDQETETFSTSPQVRYLGNTPLVIDAPTYGSSTGRSVGGSYGEGAFVSSAISRARNWMQSVSNGVSESLGLAQTLTRSQSEGGQRSQTEGYSVSPQLLTLYRPKEEVMSYYSLQDVRYMAGALLQNLAKAQAIIKYGAAPAQLVNILHLDKPDLWPGVKERFLAQSRLHHPVFLPHAQARKHITDRHAGLFGLPEEDDQADEMDDIFS